MIRTTRPRTAFTLVELLVALALGIALLALAVAVSQSSAFDSYKVVGSGDRLSQWMLVAKNRALRDRAPRGIRLIPDPNNANLVREVAYIEQPEPWVPTANLTITGAGGVPGTTPPTSDTPRLIVQRVVAQSPPQVPGGPPDNTRVFLINCPDPTGLVQAGDTLHLPELGASFLLSGNPVANPTATTDPNPPPQAGTTRQWPPPPTAAGSANVNWQINTVFELPIVQANQLGAGFGAGFAQTQAGPPFTVAPTYHTTNFAVFRQPRVLMGLPTEQLPSGMAVDVGNSIGLPPPGVGGSRDLLFAPSGEQIGASGSVVGLLLRDANLQLAGALNTPAGYTSAGQMIIVCLYPKTGAISTQPVNPPPPSGPVDLFKFARDGINTGL